MKQTTAAIIAGINAYMASANLRNRDWYVGIASKPRQRLFVDHNVSEQNGRWIYREAITSQDARQIEQAYLDVGCSGGSGGGDYTTVFVYAYVITPTTVE